MAVGLPCVTSNVWALSEMVTEGESGFMVRPDDPVALAARLERLLGDQILATQMGVAGRHRVETEFSWTQCAATIQAAIDERISYPSGMRR